MPHKASRLSLLSPYAFAEVDRMVAELRKKGVEPIDFGVGDPIDPTPAFVLEAEKKGLDENRAAGYPSYIGSKNFREKIAQWMKGRFGVRLDPETEITSTIGSKEAIFHFPFGFVNPGDYAIMPSPGYPPYKTGTLFAGGIPYTYPLLEKNHFFPDFDSIPKEVRKKAKIIWLNYPNSPTGKCATPDFFKRAVEFGKQHDIIVASDECYSEIYFDAPPRSILEFGNENIVAFHSLSKRSNMTGHRVGWVCGDRAVISVFKQVKTNIDSGTPNHIQSGAVAALSDESHVKALRHDYLKKQKILLSALKSLGLKSVIPEATFYLWQRVPAGETSVSFAKKLLAPKTAIVVTPGEWISDECDGTNPGRNFVRFALVPSIEEVEKAADKLKRL